MGSVQIKVKRRETKGGKKKIELCHTGHIHHIHAIQKEKEC